MTQEEAARLLGICERTFRRYIDRLEDESQDGLIDKRLNLISHRRTSVDQESARIFRESRNGV